MPLAMTVRQECGGARAFNMWCGASLVVFLLAVPACPLHIRPTQDGSIWQVRSERDVVIAADPKLEQRDTLVPVDEDNVEEPIENSDATTDDPTENSGFNTDDPIKKPDTEIEDEEFKSPVDYTGAQLWQVRVKRGSLALISELKSEGAIHVWGGNHSSVDVLVNPDATENVSKILQSENISYNVIITDLQKLINEENPPATESQQELESRQGHRMTWQQYHRLSDIHDYLEYLAKTYPQLCSVQTIGKSHLSNDIKLIKISNGNPNNKAVFIDGGIHAREWISPAVVTYFINEIVQNFDIQTDDIKNIDWYIVPVLNPDGYEYSHTRDRLWRKNRRKGFGCSGIDLNRNFGYKWGGKGTSKNPCSEIYAGQGAFSEPESRALADFITKSGVPFRGYLSYHSYGQYILYPWGYDSVVPPDHEELNNVGNQMAMAIAQGRGTKYSVGTSSILLYPAAGGSDDWMKAIGNIKYAYTVELSDTGNYGFVLPASYILPVSKESMDGLKVFARALSKK